MPAGLLIACRVRLEVFAVHEFHIVIQCILQTITDIDRYLSPEWILALVGILTFGAVWYQAKQTAVAAKATRESTDVLWASQRAQIVAEPHGNPAQDILGEDCRLQIELRNKGMTPAYDVVTETWLEILPFPFENFTPKATYFKATEKPASYPNHTPIVMNIPLQRQLTELERSKIRRFELYACVRIRVEYRDGRSPGRYSNFGFFVQHGGFGFLPKYNNAN